MPTPFPVTSASLSPRLYDAIMAEIEPELTSAVAPTLKQKYRHESAAEKAARLARYEQAFATFDAMVPKVLAMLQEDAWLGAGEDEA